MKEHGLIYQSTFEDSIKEQYRTRKEPRPFLI